jgi:sigma-B regulation protein RsbU (phosphoserine phosphatase)
MNAAGMFVTVLYGVLDAAARSFTFARAGHEQPLLLDPEGESRPVEQRGGQLLAILPNPVLEEVTLTLPPGWTLVMQTDGATDAVNVDGQRFQAGRFQAAVQANLGGPAQALCDRVLAAITTYQAGCPQADDITLVALRSI